ncbi:Signal transduction histidine kinase [Evansella caseinilytica]|uniref:histidine kinase n=1 Tax=Evansella caseinilytica TaxID=1503961 RepID=A0A1H3Q6T6_9BACI|nr:HAMP domain-containing sensor histidine kinase [Evansella caseinilytica]SDZ09224.1 Signal transduction histidine kinase [Evansella caseinilytica]
MDTKWKSRVFTGIWVFAFTIGMSGVFAFFTHGSHYFHRDYFHTPDFQHELDDFVTYLSLFELYGIDENKAKRSITVTQDEIDEYRYRYGAMEEQLHAVRNQYDERVAEAWAVLDTVEHAEEAYIEEREEQLEEIIHVFEDDEYVKQKVLEEKEQLIDNYLLEIESDYPDFLKYQEQFLYYFENPATGKTVTNLNITLNKTVSDYIKPETMQFIGEYSISEETWEEKDGAAWIEVFLAGQSEEFEGKIGLAKNLSPASPIMAAHDSYKQEQIVLLVYSLTGVAALISCFYFVKKRKVAVPGTVKWRPYYNRLPIDLRAVFLAASGVGAFLFTFVFVDLFPNILKEPALFGSDTIFSLTTASILWGLTWSQGKFLLPEFTWENLKMQWDKALLKKGWQRLSLRLRQLTSNLKEAFVNKSVGTQLLVLLTIVFALGAAVLIVVLHPVFLLFYLILLALVGFPVLLVLTGKIGYFNRIVAQTEVLAAGKLGQDLPVSEKSVLAKLAANINLLKQGVKASQNEQAKSERLKTELITNVSHDLRTPLTSIITYTGLLKSDNLTADERTAYLEIIDRKSKRLKMLIDDLFEVSKMASGNIELSKEKIDLVQLLQQALAENDNAISESSLHFRVTSTVQTAYAFVDGQKLWRVFDNLIGNILKYSLENSRVYISIQTLEDQAMITFKNVSKFELNDNIDELFERFKRGDESRHTEGSGLGLAIAKSIVDLHEGTLDIETDGDLFKVIISLKLAE